MTARRRWWAMYGACAAIVVLALMWVTATVLRLERAETTARADADQQEAMRLALWRMDSALAPHLAREAARPYFDYLPFFPLQRAYTRLLNQIERGEVLTPSPLLTFESDVLRLHFQVSPDGAVTSPQVPTGNLRDLAEASYLARERIDANVVALERVAALLGETDLASCVAESETLTLRIAMNASVGEQIPPLASAPDPSALQAIRNTKEWTKRQGSVRQTLVEAAERSQIAPRNIAQSKSSSEADAGRYGNTDADAFVDADAGGREVVVGTLSPVWLVGATQSADPELVFLRRVRVDDGEYFQGALCNWPVLRDSLLGEIADLVDGASLMPTSIDAGTPGSMLATLPLSLELAEPVRSDAMVANANRIALALTWAAVLAGMIAVAVTLRSSIAFGERRSRFATAVTHELRSPLTTFRLYTEMLADGMVTDQSERQSYLETLRNESGRLATLVENVLGYARLEEGRPPPRLETVSVSELLSRAEGPLRRRAEESDTTLTIGRGADDELRVRTDVDAVGQILMNLVDNACKYADVGTEERAVRIEVVQQGRVLHVSVSDRGHGVPPALARRIFEPFERGTNGDSEKPGIGLGLSLARGLARDLGGDLELETAGDRGAAFRLTLPISEA